MSFQKINDKKYSIRIDGNLTDIDVPYGKSQALFEAFVGSGGVIDSEGNVKNDVMSMVRSFGTVGDILLSKYGAKGAVVEQGDCSELSTGEAIELFQMASEIVSDFIQAITQAQSPQAEPVAEDDKKAKKTPKA